MFKQFISKRSKVNFSIRPNPKYIHNLRASQQNSCLSGVHNIYILRRVSYSHIPLWKGEVVTKQQGVVVCDKWATIKVQLIISIFHTKWPGKKCIQSCQPTKICLSSLAAQ